VKSKEQLEVPIPLTNETFHSLAVGLMKNLPRDAKPSTGDAAERWRSSAIAKLHAIVRDRSYDVKGDKFAAEENDGVQVTWWKLALDRDRSGEPSRANNRRLVEPDWTIPAVEFARTDAKSTAVVLNDAGRAAASAEVSRLLGEGKRVIVVDPWYFGESKVEKKDYLFALLLATTGDRPLGLQASQVASVARWAQKTYGSTVTISATGPRSSLFSLIAMAIEPQAIGGANLSGSLTSLKEVIEQNKSVDQWPEMFCFGLLETFNISQLVAICAPRPVIR